MRPGRLRGLPCQPSVQGEALSTTPCGERVRCNSPFAGQVVDPSSILVELPVAIFWGFSRQLTGRRSPDKTLFLEVIDALQRVSGAM